MKTAQLVKPILNLSLTLGLTLGTSLSALAATAVNSPNVNPTSIDSGGQRIEIPVETVLAPSEGFDDNDNIEVVLHGSLPNSCYRLENYTVEKVDNDPGAFRIRQFAVKKNDGVCGDDNAMPDHFKMSSPFTNVVSLGSLPAGRYDFKYSVTTQSTGIRSLTVGKAPKASVDDYPYAAVSNAMTTDVIKKNDHIVATLTGVFTSSCSYLEPGKIKVKKVNDVYVVMPVLSMRTGVYCIESLIPFTQTLDLGVPLQDGHYLVHVRSMSGKSLNRVVEAID